MGSASVTWWGTLAFMLIEGTRLCARRSPSTSTLRASRRRGRSERRAADLRPGHVVTVAPAGQPGAEHPRLTLGRSAGPAEGTDSASWSMAVFGIAPLVLRIYEFPALHVSLGQQRLRVDRLDCCSACTPPT